MSVEKAEQIKRTHLSVCSMYVFCQWEFDTDTSLEKLPDPVLLIVNVDAFETVTSS
jgi:hypothetical protein